MPTMMPQTAIPLDLTATCKRSKPLHAPRRDSILLFAPWHCSSLKVALGHGLQGNSIASTCGGRGAHPRRAGHGTMQHLGCFKYCCKYCSKTVLPHSGSPQSCMTRNVSLPGCGAAVGEWPTRADVSRRGVLVNITTCTTASNFLRSPTNSPPVICTTSDTMGCIWPYNSLPRRTGTTRASSPCALLAEFAELGQEARELQP